MVPQQYRKSCIHDLDRPIWRSELICASCSLFDSSDWLFFLPNLLRWLFSIHIRVLWLPLIPVQPCQLSVFTTFFSISGLFCLGSFLELQFPQRSKFLRTGAFVLPFLFDSVPLFYRVSVGADSFSSCLFGILQDRSLFREPGLNVVTWFFYLKNKQTSCYCHKHN